MRSIAGIGALATMIAIPIVAQAEVVKVRVMATSGPWDRRTNPRLPFGRNDERPPTVVPIFGTRPGTIVKFNAEGWVEFKRDDETVGPDGNPRTDVTFQTGDHAGFPSEYIDPAANQRPNAMVLMGAFVNADGVVIGRPFLIGSSAKKEVPEGAVAITMGVNDGEYRGNQSEFTVKVTTTKPTVTVEGGDEGASQPSAATTPSAGGTKPPAAAAGVTPDGDLTVRVAVDARSAPWSTATNPEMPFGTSDAAPPVRVTGFAADVSGKMTIVPAGTTTVEGVAVPPGGIEGDNVNDLRSGKSVYPSFYAPRVMYPIRKHALIGVFTDTAGRVLGRPFPIGTGVRVPIPEGAGALQLGFNDISSAGNQEHCR